MLQNIGENLGVIGPDATAHGKQFLVRLVSILRRLRKNRAVSKEAIHFGENK
jgi:hypothetical protein